MSRYHRDRAAELTRPQRHALVAVDMERGATTEHVDMTAKYHCVMNGVPHPRLSLRRSLVALRRRGLVQSVWLASDDRNICRHFWTLTETGEKVARYVYADGEVAHAP